ncbi:RPA-related protein RADX-like isoform X2 [Arapaima gigas]
MAPHYGNNTCGNNESFKFLAYTVTYCLVFPVGLLCNFLALYVFLRLTPKKSANTVFTTNLALSDVGFSLTLPFRLVYYLRGGHWDFPDWFCRWCIFSFYVNLYTSVLFLTSLSVLRYLAVLHPIRNKSLLTVRRAQYICLAIWLFVAAASTPFLLTGTTRGQEKVRCFEPSGPTSWRRIFTLNYVAVTFGFLLPFLTILVCYSCIIHRLVVHRTTVKRRLLSRRRAVNVMAVILFTFLLCFLPYHVARSAHLHAIISMRTCQLTERLQKVLVVTLCLAAANSCFNPLLYYFSGETFRNTVRNSSQQWLSASLSSFKQGRAREHGDSGPNCGQFSVTNSTEIRVFGCTLSEQPWSCESVAFGCQERMHRGTAVSADMAAGPAATLRPDCALQRTLRPRGGAPGAREGARTCREPLYVLSLERYAKDPSSALFFPQALSASERLYDATLSDGDCRVRVTLHPRLNPLLEANALSCGCRVRDVTFCADGEAQGDRDGGRSFRVLGLTVDTEAGADAALEAFCALNVDSLPWFGLDGDAAPSFLPLRARRNCYLPLWNEQDYCGAAWNESAPQEWDCDSGDAPVYLWVPSEPEPTVTLQKVRRVFHRRSRAPRGVLVVRVLRKSRLVFYGKAESSCECPYKAALEVADRSGRAIAVLWNTMCTQWYRTLHPGLVLHLSGYRVKEGYGTRTGDSQENDIEISLNSRNPSACISVVPPDDILPQWGLPDTPFTFYAGNELLACPPGTVCDIIGLVVFVGRPERLRNRDGRGAELWEYRWLRLEDGTTEQPIMIQLFSTSQPEIHCSIYPMSILVCTNMQLMRTTPCRTASFQYLTNTSFTQVYCTGSGHHSSMPYRRLRPVRGFVQWLHTVHEGQLLNRAITGGFFAFPPLSVSLEHFLKDSKGDPGLLSGEELRRETEKLQYRESRRFTIQATVMAVSFRGLEEGEELTALTGTAMSPSVCVHLSPMSPSLKVAVGSVLGSSALSSRKRLFHSVEPPRKRCSVHMCIYVPAFPDFSLWEASMEFLQEDSEDEDNGQDGITEQCVSPNMSVGTSQGPRLGSAHAFRETVPRAFCPQRRSIQAAAIGFQAAQLQDTLPCRKLDTFAPAPHVYNGHYTLTLRALSDSVLIDALFLPASPENPHWCPHVTHNNTWESILLHGGFSLSVPPPAPSDLMGAAPQLHSHRLVCVLQICHLGPGRLEVVLRCAYPLRD